MTPERAKRELVAAWKKSGSMRAWRKKLKVEGGKAPIAFSFGMTVVPDYVLFPFDNMSVRRKS